MVARIKVTLDERAIGILLQGTTSAASRRAANATVVRARTNLRAAGRHDTGALSKSIKATRVEQGTQLNASVWAVGSNLPYAIFQEEGIGPVHAKPGHVLRFKPKGAAAFIFRPRTRGFPGAHYLAKAAEQVTVEDFLP